MKLESEVDRLTAEVERLRDITCECGDAFDSRAKCVNCLAAASVGVD